MRDHDADHPTETALLALADGALPADAARQVRDHVEACARCAGGLREVEALATRFQEAIQLVDAREPLSWRTPTPAVDAERRTNVGVGPARHRRARAATREGWARRWVPLAAASLLVSASAAALWHTQRAALTRATPTGTARAADTESAAPTTFALPGERLTLVDVRELPRGARLTLTVDPTLDGRTQVEIFGSTAPRFRASGDRLTVSAGEGAEFVRVRVAPSARDLSVAANGRVVARLERGQAQPAAARTGAVVVSW